MKPVKAGRIVRKTITFTRAAYERLMEERDRRDSEVIHAYQISEILVEYVIRGGKALPISQWEEGLLKGAGVEPPRIPPAGAKRNRKPNSREAGDADTGAASA